MTVTKAYHFITISNAGVIIILNHSADKEIRAQKGYMFKVPQTVKDESGILTDIDSCSSLISELLPSTVFYIYHTVLPWPGSPIKNWILIFYVIHCIEMSEYI